MLTDDDIRFIVAISSKASLSAAAREIGVTAPAVTLKLQSIEKRLGVKLVERNSRGIGLTLEGNMIAQKGERILEQIAELENSVSSRLDQLVGSLRILASFGFGRKYIAPFVSKLSAEHLQAKFSLTLTDSVSTISPKLWDVAVHVGSVAGLPSTMKIRRIMPNRRVVSAAPRYLLKAGVPKSPKDLKEYSCIVLTENGEDSTLWKFRKGTRDVSTRVLPTLSTNDGQVAKQWAIDGHGVLLRSEWDVVDDIRAGRLVEVLAEYEAPMVDVLILFANSVSARSQTAKTFVAGLQRYLRRFTWPE